MTNRTETNRTETNKQNNILLGVFIILNVVFAFIYTPWIDEAQSYMIGKYLTLDNMWYRVGVEGHTPWYWLMVKPIAVMGMPLVVVNLISIIFATFVAYLILFKSKFSLAIKLGLVFSPLLTATISITARPYSIMLALIVYITYLYKDRHKYTLNYVIALAILVQTHVFNIGFVLILCLLFMIECINKRSRNMLYLSIPLISAILLALQLAPGLGENTMVDSIMTENINTAVESQITLLIVFHFILLYIVIFILLGKGMNKNTVKAFLILWFTGMWQIFICFISDWVTNRLILFVWNFVVFAWIYRNEVNRKNKYIRLNRVFAVILVIVTVVSTIKVIESLPNNSGARDICNYILKNKEIDKDIILTNLESSVSVYPELERHGYHLWNPLTGEEDHISHWDYPKFTVSYDEVVQYAKKVYNNKESVYLLVTYTTYNEYKDKPGIEILTDEFITKDKTYIIRNEAYGIFKLNLGEV